MIKFLIERGFNVGFKAFIAQIKRAELLNKAHACGLCCFLGLSSQLVIVGLLSLLGYPLLRLLLRKVLTGHGLVFIDAHAAGQGFQPRFCVWHLAFVGLTALGIQLLAVDEPVAVVLVAAPGHVGCSPVHGCGVQHEGVAVDGDSLGAVDG